jgi:signal transduction histidine kinase
LGTLKLFRFLKPSSLRGQFNLALALLTFLFVTSSVVAIQSLDETARESSKLSNDRLELLEDAQALERISVQIEKETGVMQHSVSGHEMLQSYNRIVSYLRKQDAIVSNLGQAGNTVSVLTFQQTAQLFRSTIHVLAKLHEQVLEGDSNAAESTVLTSNLQLFSASLALQGEKLSLASEELSNDFNATYREAVRQLSHKAEVRRVEVLTFLAVAMLFAWLVSSRFLGKVVISRLQRVSEYLRNCNEVTPTEPHVPVTGNDEIGQMARAVEHYMREHQQFSKIREQAAQNARFIAVGQLAAGIAHEINTPAQYIGNNLHFIGTIADQMIQDTTCAAWREDLSEVVDAVAESREGIKHVSAIVLSMKEFSHPGTSEHAEANINRALENALSVTQSQWKHVATINRNFDPDLPLVSCDIGKINQVFLNLIVNAAQAIEDSDKAVPGEIKISTSQAGSHVEIRICDTGIGINQDIRERIFDPFFTTKDPGKGTGQGLAICHDIIVQKHGGSIEVSGNDGAEFTIRLPLGRDENEDDSGVDLNLN